MLEGDKLLGTVSLTDIASLLHRLDAQLNTSPTRLALLLYSVYHPWFLFFSSLLRSLCFALNSAKSDYINLILPRKGLPTNTSLDESTAIEYARYYSSS